MTADSLRSDLVPDVVRFASRHLPARGDQDGWDHHFSTAYQIGCSVLVALGHATETVWGAVPRAISEPPSALPRWDDVCLSVLWLAEQQRRLVYRLPDGRLPRRPTVWIVQPKPRPPPAPNIAAAHGLGPAHAAEDVLVLLQALGLVADGRWTAPSETVLWRTQPQAWGLDVVSEMRFVEATEQAVRTAPKDIWAQMSALVTISQADIAETIAQRRKALEETRVKHGPMARLSKPLDRDGALRGLVFQRQNQLDWRFFRGWRLAGGWLSSAEAARALPIFHDQLAIAMRRAVVPRLFPGHVC
ncbi:MAG: hypothetical protein AAGC57_16890 [Pseudomonadota bacterium]